MSGTKLEKCSKAERVDLVLALQRPSKTSRTSSKPPSWDIKAKRENSKPGGAKPGHEGKFRSLSANVNEVVDHRPCACSHCGHRFASDRFGKVIGEYDAIDLPAIAPLIERHRRLACQCSHCGTVTKAPLPVAASGSPFGPNIATLAIYPKPFQQVSCQRLQGLFADVFGLVIRQGALMNLLKRAGEQFATQNVKSLDQLRRAEGFLFQARND